MGLWDLEVALLPMGLAFRVRVSGFSLRLRAQAGFRVQGAKPDTLNPYLDPK